MTVDIEPLLEQCRKHNGRGNMPGAIDSILSMIELLAAAVNEPMDPHYLSQVSVAKQMTIAPKAEVTVEAVPSSPPIELPFSPPGEVTAVTVPPTATPSGLINQPMADPVPIKRKVGRPRKYPLTTEPHTE